MRKCNVLIAIPANTGRENFPVPFAQSLALATAELERSSKVTKVDIKYFGGLRVDSVRCLMVRYAREKDFDVLIMVDDDMAFPADTFVKLINNYDAGRQVVTALYMSKQNWPFVYYISPPETPTEWLSVYEDGKIYQVHFLGTGIVMMDVKIFDALDKPYFLLRMDLDGRIVGTEDCYFAMNCYLHDIKCYVDTNIKAGHLRLCEYPKIFEDPYITFRGRKDFAEAPLGNVHVKPRTEQYRPPAPLIAEPVEGFYWQDGIDWCAHQEVIEIPTNMGNEKMYHCKECGYIGPGLDPKYRDQAKKFGGIAKDQVDKRDG